MYAMKCLDKKRIKMKQGESLAINERLMLNLGNSYSVNFLTLCLLKIFLYFTIQYRLERIVHS